MQHMDRTFHNVTGHVTHSDSGMFLFPFDRIGLSYMKQSVPALSLGDTVNCDDVPYCGWPFYLPIIYYTHVEYVSLSVCLSVCVCLSVLVVCFTSHKCWVTTCLENLEMPGNLIAVGEMSGNLVNVCSILILFLVASNIFF